jgi:hypothetical protein
VEADLVCWPSFLLDEADIFFYKNQYPLLAEFPSLQGRISPCMRPISLQQGSILLSFWLLLMIEHNLIVGVVLYHQSCSVVTGQRYLIKIRSLCGIFLVVILM